MGWVKNTFTSIANTFENLLPDGGGKKSTNDEANVIKTSPTVWEYELFRLEWDRRTALREIELILKADTRIKRANKVFASTAVRKGITVTVTSEVSEGIAAKAQEVINELMRDCQINSKLNSWARILLKDGDLFLNPVIDLQARKIKNIKRLPALTIQRNDDMTGNFTDVDKAFQQIDPISLEVLMEFPLWAINHIRWNHEEGERYGESQYLQCRGYWKKLNMSEEDLVVRRRTRAVPRRLHSIGTKDNPGDWSEVENYKKKNGLDNPKKAQLTTDYYGNGLTDVKDLNADAQLDHIKDIEHLQEVYMLGTGVPLNILGFGQNVARLGPVDTQSEQFKEDVQELRGLLEYGDSSPYSGLRFIFDFALALAGINPMLADYNIRWFENDNETADSRVDRVIKLRSSQPSPLISKKLALTVVSKDLGLENETAIEAELEVIKKELDEDRQEQQTIAGDLNPEKPSTNPIGSHSGSSTDNAVRIGAVSGGYSNDWVGTQPTMELYIGISKVITERSSCSDTKLITTSATNVATFTPAAQGNFEVKTYLRVTTAATNVTLTITYTDASGAQTNTVFNNQSFAVGSYSLPPTFFNALSSGAITVTVTAGTANQVYVSSAIVEV